MNPHKKIQMFKIKLVSGFHKVLWFPPPINSHSDITEILLKVALNTINQPTFSVVYIYNTL
jgi:hypothetical protein